MKKHLTYDQRLDIQRGLKEGLSFSKIGEMIGKNRSTVAREVMLRRKCVPEIQGNICVHRSTCELPQSCQSPNCTFVKGCRTCGKCKEGCTRFEAEVCMQKERPPYVCNRCNKRGCKLEKWKYEARPAQRNYEETLRQSRQGISLTDQQLHALNCILSTPLRNGHSIPVIYQQNKGKIMVSQKTIYNYIDQGLFEINNLDLRRKVQRASRKKSGPVLKVDYQCHQGRCYEDFLAFADDHPDMPVIQMDTVEGKKGGSVLLTLLFTNCDLQLAYLREQNTAQSVTQIFRMLQDTLGVLAARFCPKTIGIFCLEFAGSYAA